MSDRLINAILSMDAYNRGYDAAIIGLPVSGKLGNVIISFDSAALLGIYPLGIRN
jgi:hypothetical protein